MKKSFILIFLLPFIATAQTIYLQSGNVVPQKNIRTLKNFNGWEQYQHKGYTYAILQFSKPTTAPQRAIIEKQTGIQFIDYIPRYAFTAAIPTSINIAQLENFQVKSIIPYEPNNKIAQLLKQTPLPKWIERPNDNVELIIETYKTISKEEFTAQLQLLSLNNTIVNWQNDHSIKIIVPKIGIQQLANLSFVKWVQPTTEPIVPDNLMERTNHRVNTIDAEYSTGKHYDGTGVTVGVGDDGYIGPHIDFKGRLTYDVGVTVDNGTHGDHVAGIVGGGGNFEPFATGNAKGCQIHYYMPYDNITKALADYDALGVRITSLSYGQTCNAGYTTNSRDIDLMIRQRYSLMSVFSSGNSGGTTCGPVNDFYTITGGYKAGKNVIAVGNLDNADVINGSSSKGPTPDGRIKPDICAVGTNVHSTQPNNTYADFTGTSMSCPAVSGTLADLWQAYRETHAGADPYSALMKGTLMNTADDVGNPGPDFKYGYGRINARRALRVLENNQFLIDSVNTGITNTHTITVPAGVAQLKVMVYWTDFQGNPAASIDLVNDINITLTDPSSTTFNPWRLNTVPATAAVLNANAIRAIDSLNNMEQITINTPAAGVYTIDVNGFDIPQGPQTYVLVYDFVEPGVHLTYPQGGESFAHGFQERIRWDALGNAGTFTLEYSENAGATWTTLSSTIAANLRYYDWTPPATIHTGQMLMRISRGASTDVSDTLFNIHGVPTGLTVDTACGSTLHLKWDALPNATSYNVYMLGAKYMDLIGATANTFFNVTGISNTDTLYFAVSALENTNGAKGRKTIAYQKLPGEINCLGDIQNVETTIPFTSAFSCANLTAIPITIKLKNVGLANATNIPVRYRINANPIVSETAPITLNIGDSALYTFTTTGNFSTLGNYTVTTWCKFPGDANWSNDTSFTTANVINAVTTVAPLVEDFENPVFPANGWVINNPDNAIPWQKTLCFAGANGSSTHAAYMDFYNYLAVGQKDYLFSPVIDLTSVTSDSVICTFDVSETYKNGQEDKLSVNITTDCGVNFASTGYAKQGATLATAPIATSSFSPVVATQWRNERLDLSAYKGSKIIVQFVAENANGNNLFIDNINVALKNAWALGINDYSKGNFMIYPNPSSGIFNVQLVSLQDEAITYTLYTLAGQKLQTQNVPIVSGINSFNVNIESVAAGLYLLEIKGKAGKSTVKINKK